MSSMELGVCEIAKPKIPTLSHKIELAVQMTTLFSYVVDHDNGYAPNPYDGICTLVHCKFGGNNSKRNIVELAEAGDWVLGSGGTSRQSAGNGNIIYFMRVDEKLGFNIYLHDQRFIGREDHIDLGYGNEFALISHHYFYFGKSAIQTSYLPRTIPLQRLFKRGPGFRRDFPENSLKALVKWFERTYSVGMHGDPVTEKAVSTRPRMRLTRCLSQCRSPLAAYGKVCGQRSQTKN